MPKNGEKICPACAESIKIEAVICKHCRHEFSAADVALAREKIASSKRQKQIDGQLKELHFVDSVRDLRDEEISRSELAEIASSLSCDLREVEARAKKLGMDVDQEWTDEMRTAVDNALSAWASVDSAVCTQIADECGTKFGPVCERAAELGIPYIREVPPPPAASEPKFYTQRSFLIMASLVAIFMFITLVSNFNSSDDSSTASVDQSPPSTATYSGGTATNQEREAYSRDQYDKPTGLSGEAKKNYDSMSPQGQEYVDEQMAKYDELCARSSEC